MARNFFDNLPSTRTPLTAPRLNELLDGDESMGNIVVDSIKGKNLFGGFGWTRTTNGITFDYIGNGKIKVNGTSTASAFSMIASNAILITLPAGTYTFSGGTSIISIQVLKSDGTTIDGTTSSVFSKSFTLSETTDVFVRLVVPSGNTINNQTISVQLEKGSTVSTFSEYKNYGYFYGSNEKGNYIKYDDGTLMQWNAITVTDQAIDNAYGASGLYWGRRNIIFPIPFVGKNPAVTCSQFKWGTGVSWGEVGVVSLTTAQLIGVDIASRSSGTDVIISWMAIGRWK